MRLLMYGRLGSGHGKRILNFGGWNPVCGSWTPIQIEPKFRFVEMEFECRLNGLQLLI